MSLDLALNEFVGELHSTGDPTRNFGHTLRLKHMIKKIARKLDVKDNKLSLSIYFHGLEGMDRKKLGNFLLAFGHTDEDVEYLDHLETFTNIEAVPNTVDEKIIHDAHILEGGPFFALIKSIISGLYNGQSFEHSMNRFENEVLAKYRCYFDYTRKQMKEQIEISKSMLFSLRDNLPRSV